MKYRLIVVAAVLVCGALNMNGQKYFTKSGELSFFSETDVENIEAINKTANSVLDLESGKVQWAALIKAFSFEKALMEEHFNENYMESGEYPKATFKGVIADHQRIANLGETEETFEVTGTLEIHGVKKEVTVQTKMKRVKGQIIANSQFEVLISDYNIKIPKVVVNNISENILISVSAVYNELK